MNNSRNNSGWIFFAGIIALATAVVTMLMHRPTRKRIRTSLEEAIDQTDRKLDELEHQTRRVAHKAGQQSNRIKQKTIRDLQTRLTNLQKKLDELQE